ncbi:MAG: hypothetical protein MPJ50_13025 [Pirellulales bacterium]|nr:hypothetical protein [Pirellulales bacterium]
MLVLIRQPLGAAALLGLLGSGLWSAEVLAYAGLQAQLTGPIAWDAAAHEHGPPGDSELVTKRLRRRSLPVSKRADSSILNALASQFGRFTASADGVQSRWDLAFWHDAAESSRFLLAIQAEPATFINAGWLDATLPAPTALYGSGAECG